MSGNPADHPAVAGPKAALATGSVLAAPVIPAQVVGASAATAPRNEAEQLLRDLFPGKMTKVKVESLTANLNPIATASMNGQRYAAWTQSDELIYYRDDLEVPNLFMAFVLWHEASHVLQFQQFGTKPPDSFALMLNFEARSYQQTYDWFKNAKPELKRLGFDPYDKDKDDYDYYCEKLKDQADTVKTLYVNSLLRYIGQFAVRSLNFLTSLVIPGPAIAAPPSLLSRRIFFDNMAASHFIPNAHTRKKVDPNTGQSVTETLYYKAEDMYRGNSTQDLLRFKKLGFP